jgi:hypothetical protein
VISSDHSGFLRLYSLYRIINQFTLGVDGLVLPMSCSYHVLRILLCGPRRGPYSSDRQEPFSLNHSPEASFITWYMDPSCVSSISKALSTIEILFCALVTRISMQVYIQSIVSCLFLIFFGLPFLFFHYFLLLLASLTFYTLVI